ncbi:MAG: L,D-transpeptidase [Eubacterium sp.]|nr:L,D-transpeptidase [Eubacterium sp.]
MGEETKMTITEDDITDNNLLQKFETDKADGEKTAAAATDGIEADKAETDKADGEKTAEAAADGIEADSMHVEPYVDKTAFAMVKKKKVFVRNIILFFAFLLVAGYFVMVYLSSKYFPPGTTINGKDYSLRTYDSVLEDINRPYSVYTLHLKFRNGEYTLKGEDVGYYATCEKDLRRIKDSQNPLLWFMDFFDKKEDRTVNIEIGYDEKKLDKALTDCKFLQIENMTEPQEPEIVYNDIKERVEAVERDKGTRIDTDMIHEIIARMIPKRESYLDVRNSGCYIDPKYSVDSKKVTYAVDRANGYLSTKIDLYLGDYKIGIPARDIYSILTIDEDYNVEVPRRNVEIYVIEFARKYDTYDTYRNFKTHDGKTYKVKGEKYGYEIDITEESNLLYIDLVHRIDVERPLTLLHSAYTYDDRHNDIGGSYVEVNLSKQMVYLYVNGEQIMESECVSGNMAEGHGTPGGLYKIDGMAYDVVLRGDDYASPVLYWMPFNGGIGFHDASWRSYFGGDIYKENGSHGCVNMPIENARLLYQTVERGFPVICYWEDELE